MNHVPRLRAHFLLVCLLAFAAPAAAQQDTPDPRSNADAHLGIFYLTPKFAVKEFGLDSNVFNNADEKKDFTFTLAPHADVWLPFSNRGLITTSVGADVSYYATYASERSVNPDVKVRGELFLNRINPFVEASYLNTRQRPNYEIDIRSRRREEGQRAGVRVRVTPKFSVELAGSRQTLDFNADAIYQDVNLRQVLNRETRTASLTIRHNLTPLTTLALRTEAGNDRFEFAPLRNSDTVRIMPGVELKARALISGSAYVGVRRFTPKSDLLQPFSGTVAATALNYVLKGSTRFTFTADRDLTYSYEEGQPYYVATGFGLNIRRQIIGRTDVTVGAQRIRNTYRDLLLPGTDATDLKRVDRTMVYNASFGYRLGQTRVGVGARYQQRDTTSLRFRDYQGLRFISTVDYDF
jgi:hypothetical protein